MKSFFRSLFNLPSIIGLVLGAIGGYAYYYFVGCKSGSCPITSNPWNSLAWGLIMGWLLGSLFHSDKNSTKKDSQS
jgi:xanthine/uracil permease